MCTFSETVCSNFLCDFYVQVRYTGYRDRPLEERQVRFQNGCREGHAEVAFTATGTNLQLVFSHAPYTDRECDFQKERGKVCISIFLNLLIIYDSMTNSI